MRLPLDGTKVLLCFLEKLAVLTRIKTSHIVSKKISHTSENIVTAISKVIERVVHSQLSIQCRFRRGDSTQQAIAQLNYWVIEAMNGGKVTGLD